MQTYRGLAIDDSDLRWFHSYYLSICTTKTDNAWQQFVTDVMTSRHGGDFIQVDPSFRGDQGCDGYVDGLMLACYGASRPTDKGTETKVSTDFAKAKTHWGDLMHTWAFVHNNAKGLPLSAAMAVANLKKAEAGGPHTIQQWPPQTLWEKAVKTLDRSSMVSLIGAPPTARPAGMSYIAEAIRAVSRTQLVSVPGDVLPVPSQKIEFNEFNVETADLIKSFQVHTHHVRYYFNQGMPGEQFQVAEHLRAQYYGLKASLDSPDAVFHELCDQLMRDAFPSVDFASAGEARNAALLVITHFFESCIIFEIPGEI